MTNNIFSWPALRDDFGARVHEHTRAHPEQSQKLAHIAYEMMSGSNLKPQVYELDTSIYDALAGEQVARWLRDHKWSAVFVPAQEKIYWTFPELTLEMCQAVAAGAAA